MKDVNARDPLFRPFLRGTVESRFRTVAIVKAAVAALFLIIVALTLRSPVSIAVSLIDLALIPFFVWLARRHPRAAAYGLVVETALFLTPRQFVQGYVNGVNWPIYIVLPMIAGYVLMEGRAVLIGTALTGVVALPVMLLAALTLPPGMTRGDVFTAIAFVLGLMLALALIAGDLTARVADR
jgi:hypothetical protein